MAIDPQSLQILGMVLDRQTQQQEGSAQRGHEVNMANINVAQRNLENQISMNFQRQQNVEGQIHNLKNNLMSMGVSTGGFGSDSQFKEMIERIGGSLEGQVGQLEELTGAQLSELETLREMGSAFTRGATTASGFQASFDSDFNIDPESDFGAFNSAVGNNDRMLQLFADRGVEIGDNDRVRQAFIQGASNVFSDTSRVLDNERQRMDALASRSQIDFNRMQAENLSGEQFMNRFQMSEMIAPEVSGFITGDLLTLASEEVPDREKKALQADIQHRIEAGSASFATQVAAMSGINLDDLLALEVAGELTDDQQESIKYFRDMQISYQENAMRHINNLTSNPEAFIQGLQGSAKELERALEEFGTVENAIANNAIAASDLGNILGFVGNPYINSTIGGGFQALNDIMRRTKAQEALKTNSNYSTALQKATEAFQERSGINVGDRLRTLISDSVFPNNTQDSDEDFRSLHVHQKVARVAGNINQLNTSPEIKTEVQKATKGHNEYVESRERVKDLKSQINFWNRRSLSESEIESIESEIEAEEEKMKNNQDDFNKVERLNAVGTFRIFSGI